MQTCLGKNKSHANPCTLAPTDFQLYRKMKHKFYFRFSFFFAAKKRNWTSIFVFHFFPAGKETKFEFTLCSPFFLFVTFDLTDFNFLFRFSFFVFRFSFFVFRFRMEFWKRITIHFWFSVFGLWHWNWQSLFKGEYLGN